MKFGLLGEHLGHSLSPQIHKLIFEKLGLEHTYDLIELKPEELADFLANAGQAYGGVNVTIPYKVPVMDGLKTVSLDAKDIGAVNTIRFQGELGFGFNTDYFGFGRMLEHNAISLSGKKVVMLGNGGAAKAVLQYILSSSPEEILVVARDIAKAQEKLANFVEREEKIQFVSYEQLHGYKGDVMINTTSVGMFPKVLASPVAAEDLSGYEAAVDIIYNPEETKFLTQAKSAGCKICNGLYMLVAQAVASEEIWLERKLPDSLIAEVEGDLRRMIL